jgi:cyclase
LEINSPLNPLKGDLSHYIFLTPKSPERGPFSLEIKSTLNHLSGTLLFENNSLYIYQLNTSGMKTNMNFGASPVIFGRAKNLRNNQTFAEKLLWSRLRNNQLGVRFRRQHPISSFVVDFYCQKHLLVIEVDGNVHLDKTVQMEDQTKTESLIALGLHVVRFTNKEIIDDIDRVVNQIKNILLQLKPE